MAETNNKNTSRGGRHYELISEKSHFVAKEAYKSARTNLMFLLKKKNEKVVLFTSPYSGEGKTTTCINLGITFAQSGSKVLIIDSDMRKPQIHNALGVKNDAGLSEYLAGFENLSVVKKTSVENLSIITAGTIPPNPSELIMSERFDELLKTLEGNFDIIFIDTPPAGIVTDAVVMAAKGIPVVLDIRQNYTTRPAVVQVKNLITRGGGRILGYVFNGVLN